MMDNKNYGPSTSKNPAQFHPIAGSYIHEYISKSHSWKKWGYGDSIYEFHDLIGREEEAD